jgi:hypothetical protein
MWPQRRLPKPRTLHTIDGRIRENGTIRPSTADRRRRKTALAVDVVQRILRGAEENPRTSVRRIKAAEHVPRAKIWRVPHEQL